MSALVQYPHLNVDAGGSASIDGTRYKVLQLAGEHYHYGWSAEEILRQHPDLRPEQVYAALTYFYDHRAAMVEEMRAQAVDVEAANLHRTFSRAELLKRLAERETK